MKRARTTRNPKMNYYIGEDNTLMSIASISASNKYRNIKLLEYDDYIIKSGDEIIKDARKNNQMLAETEYDNYVNTDGIESDNTYYIFGSPHKWVLDNEQLYENCGLDSVLNVLVMAGKAVIKDQNKTERKFMEYLWSKRTELSLTIDGNENGILDEDDGASLPAQFPGIFDVFGIDATYCEYSNIANKTLEDVAEIIKEGGAAIIGVCPDILWGNKVEIKTELSHAITVTGVVYGGTAGEDLVGFYIHDTAAWMTRYISLGDLRKATLYHNENYPTLSTIYGAVIPDIKIGTNNTNATGNKYSNEIYGNSSANILKGMGGNDFLYGMGGDDTLYGGNGKDYIKGGDGNDLIYGGKGNDEIYGEAGDNTIYAGAGNDIIYDIEGNDYINCGSGKDRVIFSSECGKNTLTSSSGSVSLEFTDKYNDLIFDVENKKLTLSFDENNFIDFEGFYNKNKCKKTYILDSDNVKTRVHATNSKGKIKVGDKNTNNILYSLSQKNNKITTSLFDDKVIMYGGNDTITYTGGKDSYTSYAGDNTYNVNLFSADTHLTITDSDGYDKLNLTGEKSDFCLFVDYKSNGERNSDNLYIFDKNIVSSIEDFSNFLSDNSSGFICIENYFSTGMIEEITNKAEKTYTSLDIDFALDEIQSAVQGWFNDHSDCDTVLDTIRQNESIQDLIACYTDVNLD